MWSQEMKEIHLFGIIHTSKMPVRCNGLILLNILDGLTDRWKYVIILLVTHAQGGMNLLFTHIDVIVDTINQEENLAWRATERAPTIYNRGCRWESVAPSRAPKNTLTWHDQGWRTKNQRDVHTSTSRPPTKHVNSSDRKDWLEKNPETSSFLSWTY